MKEKVYENDHCKITLINGDCMDAMSQMEGKEFDLAIVDPPYFNGPNKLGYYGERISSAGVKREAYQKVGKWTIPGFVYHDSLQFVSKNQIIWGINYFEFSSKNTGRIIWDKCNGASTFSDCEIALCSLQDHTTLFRYMWNGMMQGKSISEGHLQLGNKSLNEKRIHPTQKPVALYKWLLTNYTKEGNSILDTHGGSMSIAIACWDMGFDLTLYEIDEDYYKAGVKRFEEHIRKPQLFSPNEMYNRQLNLMDDGI